MNIHEYQAKQLFADAGVAVPNGTVAQSEQEFDQALSGLPDGKAIVVKAQIHAGGRGKGTFKDGYQGGVHVVSSPDEALEKAKAMLGNVLVTKQTGEEGKEVRTVYFNEATDIEKEYYLAVLGCRQSINTIYQQSKRSSESKAFPVSISTKLLLRFMKKLNLITKRINSSIFMN